MMQLREFGFTNWFVTGENESVERADVSACDWKVLKLFLVADMLPITC